MRERRQARVLALARRSHWEERHSRHVTTLALSLFDQLAPVHELGAGARELLQYAGYLHDVGYQVSAKGHHKHSYRIIQAADWPGFEDWEVQVMAAAARYHRKRLPRDEDQELAGLDAERKRLVRLLAGFLRVADGMDRTHLSLVRRVRARVTGDRLLLTLVAGPGAELELHYGREKAGLLAQTLGLHVKAELESTLESTGGVWAGRADGE